MGEEYGPSFDPKDTIGCGYLISKREIFFTKNGDYLEKAFSDVDIPKEGLFPAICLQSNSHLVQVNLGQQKFAFDLLGFRQREGLESFFDIC